MEGEVNKFEQISGIFSQFSEENKDKLLEVAEDLLKLQKKGATSAKASQNEIKAEEGRCSEKQQL